MFIVLSKVLTVFIIIFIGVMVNKLKILPNDAIPYVTTLALYITSPCLAMYSIYSKELSHDVIKDTIYVMLGGVVYFVIVTLMSLLLLKVCRFKPKESWGVYATALSTVNSGFMGFPITKAIFGANAFYLMVMNNITLNFYMYGVVPSLLKLGAPSKIKPKQVLKSMCNVVMIGVVIGFVMLLIGYKPPGFIDEVIKTLGDATIPLSMLLVGLQLGSSELKSVIKNKYYFIADIFSMVIVPAIAFFIVDPLNLSADVKIVLIFSTAFPTAVAPVAIAEQEGQDAKTLAEIVSLTTVTSMITLPVLATILMGHYY